MRNLISTLFAIFAVSYFVIHGIYSHIQFQQKSAEIKSKRSQHMTQHEDLTMNNQGTNRVNGRNADSYDIPLPYDFDTKGVPRGNYQSSPNWDGRTVTTFQDRFASEGIRTDDPAYGTRSDNTTTERMQHENASADSYKSAGYSAAGAGAAATEGAVKTAIIGVAKAGHDVKAGIDENRHAHQFPVEDSGKPKKFAQAESDLQHRVDEEMKERTEAMLDPDGYWKQKQNERDYMSRHGNHITNAIRGDLMPTASDHPASCKIS